MKSCPKCGNTLSDTENICRVCGTDYVEATIASITGNAGATESDSVKMMLNGIEDSLRVLDSVAKPSMKDTMRRMALPIWGAALTACVVAGLLCKALFFYLLAIIPLVLVVKALIRKLTGKADMTQGERVAYATAKVFAEDASRIRAEYATSEQVIERIEAMQQKIDNSLSSLKSVHARNRIVIMVLSAVVFVLFSVGVGALAIRNHKARKAEAEYEALPAWVKARDGYLASDMNNEYGDNLLRMNVLTLMLEAGEVAAAEGFFFDSCMGYMGDADCATLIIDHYRKDGDKSSLNTFIDRLKLRYDSDTNKLRKLKL